MKIGDEHSEGTMRGDDVQILTVADAGRILNITPEAVRAMERRGKLPATRTAGGIRLFRATDVERVRLDRERKLAEGAA